MDAFLLQLDQLRLPSRTEITQGLMAEQADVSLGEHHRPTVSVIL